MVIDLISATWASLSAPSQTVPAENQVKRDVHGGEVGLHNRRESLLQQRHGDGFRFREQMGEERVEVLVAIQSELQIHERAHERFNGRRVVGFLKRDQAPHTLVIDWPDAALEGGLEQLGFGAEVIIGGGEVHIRRIGDGSQRRIAIAALAEKLHRGIENAFPGGCRVCAQWSGCLSHVAYLVQTVV